MRKKILFIVNPIAGVGRYVSVVANLNEMLDKEKFDHSIVFTKAPKHATALSKEAADKNYDIVVAVGGDGTVHETGKGLIGTNTALAIIPRGSGNGMARNLRIPVRIKRNLKVLNDCKIIKIDTVNINKDKFLGIAGVGFDAKVAWEFSKYGKRGLPSYIKISLREFKKYIPENYEINIDGVSFCRKAFMISFANSAQFGGNAVIAPGAKIFDGKIDVSILDKFPLNALPNMAYKLFTNSIDKSKYLEIIRGEEVTVKQPHDYIHLDGEPVLIGKKLRIKVNPLSLNIVVPDFSKPRRIGEGWAIQKWKLLTRELQNF